MVSAEGEFPKIGNDPIFNSEINLLRPVTELYTGAGFDSSAANTTVEGSYELTAITSDQCKSAKYARVKITGNINTVTSTSTANIKYTQLKAQIKETGGSYADIVAYKDFFKLDSGTAGGGNTEFGITSTYELVYELTAGMKTNGFQIKVFSSSYSNNVSATTTFTNVQTIQELA